MSNAATKEFSAEITTKSLSKILLVPAALRGLCKNETEHGNFLFTRIIREYALVLHTGF
jgi:hypothetical protein